MDTNTFPANETPQAEELREVENVADVSAEVRRIVDTILSCSIPIWSIERKFLEEIVPPRRRRTQPHDPILSALAKGYLIGLLGEIKTWMADKPIAVVRDDIGRRLMRDIGLD